MSRVERHLLVRLGRRSGDPDTLLRFQAVAGLAAGRSSVRVADELHVARSTVVSASRRFDAFGVDGLYDRRRFNGATKADDAFHRRVAEVLRGTPEDLGGSRPTWTCELLCVQMQREGWPAAAVCTMGRALAMLGARLGAPKPVVLCPWPRDARLRRLARIGAPQACATAAEPVFYENEVDIHLNPKVGRDWMLRGHQRRVLTLGKKLLANARQYLNAYVWRRTTGSAPLRQAA